MNGLYRNIGRVLAVQFSHLNMHIATYTRKKLYYEEDHQTSTTKFNRQLCNNVYSMRNEDERLSFLTFSLGKTSIGKTSLFMSTGVAKKSLQHEKCC